MKSRNALLAHYYDLEYRDFSEDLDFFVQYALQMDPKRRLPLLELGTGTGRVAAALAGSGFTVVGVDASEEMLAVCKERAEANGVVDKVLPVHADMRELAGASISVSGFNMVICALNTFAYLKSTEDQLAMLRGVHPLLVQHGILIIDLTPPLPHLMPPHGGELVHQGSFADGTGGTLHKMVSGIAHSAVQAHDITIFYDYETADGTLSRTTQWLEMRWTGRYEMELLLQASGYRLERVYGDYELGDYTDDSERMIFVART